MMNVVTYKCSDFLHVPCVPPLQTLSKVLCAVVKFSPEQAQEVLAYEHQRSSLVSRLRARRVQQAHQRMARQAAQAHTFSSSSSSSSSSFFSSSYFLSSPSSVPSPSSSSFPSCASSPADMTQ